MDLNTLPVGRFDTAELKPADVVTLNVAEPRRYCVLPSFAGSLKLEGEPEPHPFHPNAVHEFILLGEVIIKNLGTRDGTVEIRRMPDEEPIEEAKPAKKKLKE